MLFLFNNLPRVDKIFFLIIAAIAVIAVIIYFLIPVFKRKQYQEQIDNLHEREEAFNKNRSSNNTKDSNK